MAAPYSKSVFINCPFDDAYRPMFRAIVFTVFDCGFVARCAQEIDDSSQIRIDKIKTIISKCQYGIHDLLRTEADAVTGLPRFNMPLELGLFLGAKIYGARLQKSKVCLILDRDRYRYQRFISDIAGQDIRSHNGHPDEVIAAVRSWLKTASGDGQPIPGGAEIGKRYARFRAELPAICAATRVQEEELTFSEYSEVVSAWLRKNG